MNGPKASVVLMCFSSTKTSLNVLLNILLPIGNFRFRTKDGKYNFRYTIISNNHVHKSDDESSINQPPTNQPTIRNDI